MKITSKSLLILTFCISFFNVAEELKNSPTELSQLIDTITPAKNIVKIAPKYPRQAGRDGNEGWVQLSYLIDENGSVQNVLVMDNDGANSLARKAFIRESRRAVKKWKFTPAKNQQGDNIVSCKNSVQMDFTMGNSDVSSDYLKLLKISFKAIQDNDKDIIEELIAKINNFEGQNTNELAWSHYIEMKYFSLIKDSEKTYRKLNKAYSYIRIKNPIYTEPAALDILQNLFVIEVRQQRYHTVRKIFNKLTKFDSDYATKLQAHYQPYMAQVNKIIEGDKNILVRGKIGKQSWHHDLVRNEFSISNVVGKLNGVEIRCDNQYSTFTVKSDSAWKVPETWGQCSIFVNGDTGTTFDIYELPAQS